MSSSETGGLKCPKCGSFNTVLFTSQNADNLFICDDCGSEDSKPLSDIVAPGIDQIPFEAIEAIGEIFHEGESKYGRDNWKKGVKDKDYRAERCRHAIRHLYLWANGDRSKPHLAKVAWFCVTQIWTDKQ